MKDIEQILLCFDNSSLTELEIREESTGYFLRLKRIRRDNPERQKRQNKNNGSTNPVSEKHIVKSERVGFFNSQTSEGILVKKREIIGEIVSLKVPSPITSPCDGKIIKIYPGNGEQVEYGQLIMEIQKMEIQKN